MTVKEYAKTHECVKLASELVKTKEMSEIEELKQRVLDLEKKLENILNII